MRFADLFSPSHSAMDLANRYVVEPALFVPEPRERFIYILCLFMLPLFAWWLASRSGSSSPSRNVGRWSWLAIGASGALLINWVQNANGWAHLRPSLVFQLPLIGLLVLGAAWACRFVEPLWNGVAAFSAVLWLGTRWVGADDVYRSHMHFEAVSSALLAAARGKVLLVDTFHTYGLYPEFLKFWLKLFGAGTFSVSLLMLTLSAFVIGCLARGIFLLIESRALAAITFSACIAFSFLGMQTLALSRGEALDPYFQVQPVRGVFPALVILCLGLWKRAPFTIARTASVSFFLGLGVLFAPDAGLAALGAWSVWILFASRLKQAPALLTAVFAPLAYALYARTVGGEFPDALRWIEMLATFQRDGYFMLPMVFPHTWIGVVFVLLGGFGLGARLRDPLLGVSVLGLLLFVYFQGRSHDYNLFMVSYPALIVLGVALDRFMGTEPVGLYKGLRPALMLTLLLWASSAPLMAVQALDGVFQRVQNSGDYSKSFRSKLEKYRSQVTPGQRTLILSESASAFHTEARTTAFNEQSLVELYLTRDFDRLKSDVDRLSVLVVLDEDFERGAQPMRLSRTITEWALSRPSTLRLTQ